MATSISFINLHYYYQHYDSIHHSFYSTFLNLSLPLLLDEERIEEAEWMATKLAEKIIAGERGDICGRNCNNIDK